MLVSSIVALLATAAASVSAANYTTFNLLRDDRAAGRLVFLPTTYAEKDLILTNAENILTAWVNYDSKIVNYGLSADPFPIIKSLRKNISKSLMRSSSSALLMLLSRSVTSIPKPTVVVTDITNIPELLDLFGKDYAKIQLGDELLTINGLSFVEWFKQNQFKAGGGANNFGGQRTALNYISTIYGAINRLPTVDSITLQFKPRTHYKRVYSVTVPYVTGHSAACWGLSSTLYQKLTNVTLPGTAPPPTPPTPRSSFRKTHLSGTKAAQRQSDAIKALKYPKPLTWSIYKPGSKNMGVIKLEDFEPTDSVTGENGSDKAIMIIRSLLANELKDTNSVIFELRGNPGGYISLANGMPQLFKPDFNPFGARYLMNNITYNIFVNGRDPNSTWSKVWGETKPGSRYTNIALFNEFKDVNTLGQAYVRPLGLFNDGMCYSACDMFSANIQGHGAGVIFGEEGQTGAGGANILDLDPALITLSPNDFKPYPYTKELTWAPTEGKYYNRLSVGIRQSVRNGRYEGQLIEDLGVKTEIVVRARWSDLQPNSTTNTQYDRIADNLARIGQKSGQSKLHFVCEPFEIEKPLGKFPLAVEAAGIDEFTVFQADEKTIIAQQKATTKKQKLSIPVSAAASGLGNSRITIVGKTARKQVLKTHRNVRTIPTDDKYMKISASGFTFSNLSDSVGLYQSSVTAPGDGWNNLNGSWVIGNGVKYVENVDSSIEAFFTASVGTKINVGLNVALDTEPEFDFLYLSVKSSGNVEDFLINSKGVNDTTKTFNGVSGGNMTVKGTFPFTTKSEKFSVALKFTSDGGLNFSGATINSLTVSSA
ncbi:hypothetical protein BASA83_005600 [Batrachochytrium salamandrivorans]|nr:hypothetical protein BASA83_005600 [Batrachochytrium salamandrivorans]